MKIIKLGNKMEKKKTAMGLSVRLLYLEVRVGLTNELRPE